MLLVSKGALYYQPMPVDPYTLSLMDLIDEQHTKTPFYGSRRLKAWLNQEGHRINRKRVQRLMRLMRIEAIYPKPKLSRRNEEHKVYPYLLKDVQIERIDQVWSTDISYRAPIPWRQQEFATKALSMFGIHLINTRR